MPQSQLVSFESHDASFGEVLGDAPRLDHVTDTDAHEGPVYVAQEDSLYFTSVPDGAESAIRRLDRGRDCGGRMGRCALQFPQRPRGAP